MTVWEGMGVIRYPLSFSVLVMVALALLAALRLLDGEARTDLRTKAWIDAVLFWGGFALVTGVLGTIVGVIVAAQAIEAAGAVNSTLVWGGIKVALLSTAVGILAFAAGALVWFALQLRWRLLVAEYGAD